MKLALTLVLLLGGCATANSDAVPVSILSDPDAFGAIESTSTTASGATTNAMPVTDPVSTPLEDPEATGPNAALIDFEANWLCDAQRHVYNSPSEVDAALATSLSNNAIARTEYDAFKAMAETDETVRKEILAVFVEVCS